MAEGAHLERELLHARLAHQPRASSWTRRWRPWNAYEGRHHDRQRTAGARVTDASHGGTLDVATTGKPYPIQIRKSGKGGGKISFDRWNAPVTLAAPKNAIDLSQLQGEH